MLKINTLKKIAYCVTVVTKITYVNMLLNRNNTFLFKSEAPFTKRSELCETVHLICTERNVDGIAFFTELLPSLEIDENMASLLTNGCYYVV